MDPKTFDRKTSYKINEKSDIYSLGVIFWELTSSSSPFNYETRNDHTLMLAILNGLREEPMQNTNAIFVGLYQSKYKVIKSIAGDNFLDIFFFLHSKLDSFEQDVGNTNRINDQIFAK